MLQYKQNIINIDIAFHKETGMIFLLKFHLFKKKTKNRAKNTITVWCNILCKHCIKNKKDSIYCR